MKRWWILAPMAALFVGCIICEEEDLRVQIDTKEQLVHATDYRYHIEGDSSSAFDEVAYQMESEDFLVSRAEEGAYVTSRRMWLEGGKLAAEIKEVAHVSNYFRSGDWDMDSLGYYMKIDTSGTTLQTNGALLVREAQDTTLVLYWPLEAKELHYHSKIREFHPHTSFADSFRAYQRAKKRK